MVSTMTPVAKMTAPISPIKQHTMIDHYRSTAAKRQQKPSEANRPNKDQDIAVGKQQQRPSSKLDENNSSNKTSRPLLVAETSPIIAKQTPVSSLAKTTPKVGVTGESRQRSGGSAEKLKDDGEIADSTRLAGRLDVNNSSNRKTKVTNVAAVSKTPKVAVAGKSQQRTVFSEKSKDDKESADGVRLTHRLDENNSSNRKAIVTTMTAVSKAPKVDVAGAKSLQKSIPCEKLKKVADNFSRLAGCRFGENNSSNKAKRASRGSLVRDHPWDLRRGSNLDRNNSSSRRSQDDDKDADNRYEHDEGETDLNLPPTPADMDRSLRSLSYSTYQPEEKRRRSPSLQVGRRTSPTWTSVSDVKLL